MDQTLDERRIDSLMPRQTPPPAAPDGHVRCGVPEAVWSFLPVATGPSTEALFAHYGRQLEPWGWQEAEEETPSVARTWERSDREGGRIVYTVAVTGAPGRPGCTVAVTTVREWRRQEVGGPERDEPQPS